MVLQLLKESTQTRHAAIEARLPLMRADLSLPGYRAVLRRFLGFYEPLETQLLTRRFSGAFGFDYAPRRKTPQLRQDLLALGETPAAVDALARCPALPALATAEQAWGCLYVIEGATLGGQIITRQLHARLGLTPSRGVSFFAGYGAETGSRWKVFCALLNAHAERCGGGGIDETVASANLTFSSLDRWLFPAGAAPAPGWQSPSAGLLVPGSA
ncbi:MAG: Heme oxygenase [Polaromonas sp.]|nr:Heme oxygenase [Polaromonas sp.]